MTIIWNKVSVENIVATLGVNPLSGFPTSTQNILLQTIKLYLKDQIGLDLTFVDPGPSVDTIKTFDLNNQALYGHDATSSVVSIEAWQSISKIEYTVLTDNPLGTPVFSDLSVQYYLHRAKADPTPIIQIKATQNSSLPAYAKYRVTGIYGFFATDAEIPADLLQILCIYYQECADYILNKGINIITAKDLNSMYTYTEQALTGIGDVLNKKGQQNVLDSYKCFYNNSR